MKKALFFMTAVMAAMSLMAAPVDQAAAYNKAKRFLTNGSSPGMMMASNAIEPVLVKAELSNVKLNQPVYYIYNTSTTFLVIAGDDRAEEILMIGDAPLDVNRIPDGLQYLLDCYKEQIMFLQERPGLVVDRVQKNATPSLRATTYGPLLTCIWDQYAPFNNLCKFTYNGTTYTCLTGCPATSAAQVLYFWKHPTTAVPAIASYTSTLDIAKNQSVSYTYPALPSTTFDWANMRDSYLSNYTTAQADAVAKLMRYVGQAVKMMYGTAAAGGSGIYTNETQKVVNMFKDFGYKSTCQVIYKSSYNETNWANKIITELAAGRPVVYNGVDPSDGGHAFNVDGYRDSDGKFHVNFGWSGDGNAWYAMNAFSYAGSTFSQSQQAVIGIDPEDPIPYMTATPTSVEISTYPGETATKTFVLKGRYLTGNVSLSVSGSKFSISPTAVTAAEALNGATITVTYNSSEVGTDTGVITATSAGAENLTVELTGTTVTKPVLKATPASLNFSTSVGSSQRKTVYIKGTAITSNVTLSVSGAGYSIDVTAMTAATAMSGKSVAVTFNPTEAGSYPGSITVKSAGAVDLVIPLNGTANDNTPLITVNPTSLSFSSLTGETVTKTFTVNGANLTGDLTLTLNDANSVYSVNKTSITAAQATSGTTVTVTYAPNAAGTHNATVTVSGGGAASQTVSLNGTATEPVRTITATPSSLTFNNLVGETATQTFNVTGENLTGNLTLALNDANGVYGIEPATITKAEATAGKTVTVTYAPTVFGNHNATITISGGSANPVTVTLAGQANLIKYAPVMLEPNDLYVAIDRFRAEWTDNTPAANVASYTLEVNAKPTEPEYVEVATADFTNIEAVSSGTNLTNVASTASQYLPEGWGAENYLYINDGFVISGAVKSTGWWSTTTYGSIVSPTLDLTGYDKVTVVAKVKSYYPSNYGTAEIRIYTSAGSQDYTLGSSDDDPYQEITVVLNCASSDKVYIQGRANYFALESVHVYAGDITQSKGMLKATETGGTNYRLIEGITPDKFYTVKDLAEGGTFLYKVKALYIDGTESDWSNEQEVTLHENEHPYRQGDVNHDDVVDVNDVTMLIAFILGSDNGICPICANVNNDDAVDVSDVTAIINIILGNPASFNVAKPVKKYLLLD